MRLRHLLPALLLAACSSETPTPPVDAQVAADLCACQDGTAPPDVPAEDLPDVVAPPLDAVDAGDPLDAVDASALPDLPAVDAPDAVVPEDAPDAAQLADAPDVVVMDAPDVAVAVADAATVDAVADAATVDAVADAATVDAVDATAPTDAPDVAVADVVDAARDNGPGDAGPVLYDLNAARTGLDVRVVYRRVSAEGALDCEAAADMTNCFVASGTLNFSLRGCGRTFTGLIPLGTATGRLVVVTPGAPRATNDFSPVVVAGATAGARQGFRIGVAAPRDEATPGVTGIPGRTVDPSRGDLWLLGCEVR